MSYHFSPVEDIAIRGAFADGKSDAEIVTVLAAAGYTRTAGSISKRRWSLGAVKKRGSPRPATPEIIIDRDDDAAIVRTVMSSSSDRLLERLRLCHPEGGHRDPYDRKGIVL